MGQLIVILRALNRRKWMLIAVPILSMCAIYWFTRHEVRRYRTEARLFLNLQESKGMSLSDEDLKQYQVHSYFQNTIELLKSKRVIERVRVKAVEAGLRGESIFKNGNENLVRNQAVVEARIAEILADRGYLDEPNFPDSIMIDFLNYHQLSASSLKESVTAYRILDSNFMRFELTSDGAVKVHALAHLFIEALAEENKQLSKSKIKGHKDIIEALVKQAKNDLDEKIHKLEQYKVGNHIINLGEHTKAIVVYLVQLEGQRANLLSKIAAGQKGKTEVLDAVRNGNEVTLDLASHQEIVSLKEKLVAMNRQLLAQSLEAESNRNFRTVQQNIDHVKAEINVKLSELARKTPYDPSRLQTDLAAKYVAYDLDAETASHMVPVINAEIDRVTTYARRFAPFESTIGAYEQDISTAQNVYLTLLNKLSLTESLEFGSGENVVDVIDEPALPRGPEPSKRLLLIAAGGFSVFVLMAGFIIVGLLIDSSIKTVEDFERYSNLKVTAALPGLGTYLDSDPVARDAMHLVFRQQLIQLVSSIHATREETPVLLVGSATAGEGKHYLSEKLLEYLTAANKRVAVIDADWMSVDSSMKGAISFASLIREKGLLGAEPEIRARIAELTDKHDLILVVAAPLSLSGEISVWTGICTHAMLVFAAGRVMTRSDLRIAEQIQAAPIRFIGTILNRVQVDGFEDYLGQIPKQRSGIRVWIKKLLTHSLKHHG
ncbi:MAG: Wzz/FepE/Etk N-terminal domain-containing protein [Cyclobacteriaceae bacterium]